MLLKFTRLACIIVPLASYLIAIQFENIWITYGVVPVTMAMVALLFIIEKKFSPESNIFKGQHALLGIFGLAILFFLYSEFLL